MPTPSDDEQPRPAGSDDEGGPLKTLSFFVLLALAVEIGLLVLLQRAAA